MGMLKMQNKTSRAIASVGLALLLCGQVVPTYAEGEEAGESYYSPNPYYGGWSNCTWGAWQLAYEATGIALPGWHMAYQWADEARAAGYTVSMEPRANSIGVWNGHVVYVSDFDGQNIYIKEGGFLGGYNEAWADGYSARYGQALLGYIYLDGEVAPYSTGSADTGSTFQDTWNLVQNSVVNNVELAIAPEVKDENIENLELELVKKYDDISEETLKKEEVEAIKEVQAEENEDVATTKVTTKKTSTSFLDILSSVFTPQK